MLIVIYKLSTYRGLFKILVHLESEDIFLLSPHLNPHKFPNFCENIEPI